MGKEPAGVSQTSHASQRGLGPNVYLHTCGLRSRHREQGGSNFDMRWSGRQIAHWKYAAYLFQMAKSTDSTLRKWQAHKDLLGECPQQEFKALGLFY
jgi:hypothetical protein